MFWTVFESLCENKGMTPNGVCKDLGLSNATATHWKNGKQPSKKTLNLLSDYFAVSPEYLMAGVDKNVLPMKDITETENYSWKNEPKNEIEYRYNAAIRAVIFIHGPEKGQAMLSAVKLPADTATTLSQAQKEYLAFKIGTNANFFDTTNLLECSPEELMKKAENCGLLPDYQDIEELKRDYPEVEQWEKSFKIKYISAVQKKIDSTCFEDFIDTIISYRKEEQYKILAIFLSSVEKYKEEKQSKLNANYNNAIAKKDGSAS